MYKIKILELIYTLYLLSGFIKVFLIKYNINTYIDITLLLASLLIIILFIKIKYMSLKFVRPIVLLLLFFTWMIFTLLYTSSVDYCYKKVFLFLTNIISFSIPILLYKIFNLKNFFKYFIVISSVLNVAFIVLILPYIYIDEVDHMLSGTYLAVSYLSGINIIYLIIINNPFNINFFKIFYIIINFTTLILSGGRGGIIFTILILFIYFFKKMIKSILILRMKRKFLYSIILTFIIIFLSVGYGIKNYDPSNENNLFDRSINRLTLVYDAIETSDGGKSINTRVEYIKFSIKKIFNNVERFIFGYGIGSFSYEYEKVDKRGYPHNIILEILFEMGLIGLFFFMIFYGYILTKFHYTNLLYLQVYVLLNLLKSSGLTDIRIAFGMLALMVITSKHRKVIYDKSS